MYIYAYRTAFVLWFLMNVLLIVVPRYGAYTMIGMGSFMVGATVAYHSMLPSSPLVIRFQDDKFLLFSLGWCFWLTLFTGLFVLYILYKDNIIRYNHMTISFPAQI